MCGIAGWIRNTDTTLSNAAMDALRYASVAQLIDIAPRGRDSVGAAFIDPNGKTLFRRCVTAQQAVSEAPFAKSLQFMTRSTSITLLHTRAATTGAVTKRNAHPIPVQGILVGVHNGWVLNYKELVLKHELITAGETDTEVMFALIAKFAQNKEPGLERANAIGEALKLVQGSAAIAINFRGDKLLYLYREGNPLHINNAVHQDRVTFSSMKTQRSSELPESRVYFMDANGIVGKASKITEMDEEYGFSPRGYFAKNGLGDNSRYHQANWYDDLPQAPLKRETHAANTVTRAIAIDHDVELNRAYTRLDIAMRNNDSPASMRAIAEIEKIEDALN